MKYRKKPVVVDAYQADHVMLITTLAGSMCANPGDWIITGVHGERYPCKPDIFAETYEPADTTAREDSTIDPETLSIVRPLREELARVTAERDAAVSDLRKLVPAWKWDEQKEEIDNGVKNK